VKSFSCLEAFVNLADYNEAFSELSTDGKAF
jgi:hypothetical protein